MKKAAVLTTMLSVAISIAAQGPPPEPHEMSAPPEVAWAYNFPDKEPPPSTDLGPVHIPDSSKTYTQAEIDDFYNTPDWLPDQHGPVPSVVLRGSGKDVMACGSCHLISGLGHPESANLTALTIPYFLRQLADFKSGARKADRMPEISAALSDEDAKAAAEFFTSQKHMSGVKVVEADTVPKSYIGRGHMRLPLPGGETEPIGNRIIEVPEDVSRVTARDPRVGFIAYVPKGSIAKGEELVSNGIGGTGVGCGTCHGPSFEGLGDVPRLAGISPTYIFRQIIAIQTGARAGSAVKPMKGFVSHAKVDEAIAIAAYLASRPQ